MSQFTSYRLPGRARRRPPQAHLDAAGRRRVVAVSELIPDSEVRAEEAAIERAQERRNGMACALLRKGDL